jgi:hypothetical protein
MKGSSACSDYCASSGFNITAVCAAVTRNRILSTSVGRNVLNADIAKGFETPIKVIVKEVQPLCNKKEGQK